LRIRSGAEQVADQLRCEIMSGRWKETIPGIHRVCIKQGFMVLAVGAVRCVDRAID
jgi:hypothetical protein